MQNNRKFTSISPKTFSVAGTVLFALLGAIYIYMLWTGQAHALLSSIRGLGVYGVILGIIILTLLNIIPVPAEFMSLFLIEVYGTWLGLFCSLLAGVLGAIAASYLCQWIARPFMESSSAKFLKAVDEWIAKRGTVGLLILRFVPFVPYHLVNYICGLLKVRFWPFVWTTFLGILPYTLAMTGIFSGIRFGSMRWGVIGGCIFLVLLLIGWYSRRFWNKTPAQTETATTTCTQSTENL